MKKNPKKTPKKFYCEQCDFTSRNRKDFRRHCSTTKHKMANLANSVANKKTPYVCMVCNKTYKHKSSLSKHKKKCLPPSDEGVVAERVVVESPPVVDVEKESLKKEVSELRAMMRQMLKTQKSTSDRFTDTLNQIIPKIGNTYNNKMSINVYLNEKCKDAMNLTDFVNNLAVSLEDLAYTKDHGFVKGISNIFVKQLQDMEPTQRPIHCSDKKRLQFYVKDKDKWEKDKEHIKIDKTIDTITTKQIKQIKRWEKEHPNYLKNEHELMEWHTLVHNLMGGASDTDWEKNKGSIKKELSITLEMKNELVDKKIS